MWWRRPAVVIAVAVVAAVFYSNFVLDWMFSPHPVWLAVVSDLEVPGQPTASLMRATDVICSILTLYVVAAVWAGHPRGAKLRVAWILLAIFGLADIVTIAIPLPCGPEGGCVAAGQNVRRHLHDGFSVLSAAALFLNAAVIAWDARRHGPRWAYWLAQATFWVGGILGTVLFGYYGFRNSHSWETGLSQRFQLVWMSVWMVALGVLAVPRVHTRGSA